MNKREAKKHAHTAAWKILQQAIDQADIGDWSEDNFGDDAVKIQAAYEELIQHHFNRSSEEQSS